MTNLELTLEPVPDSVPQARQTLDRLADAVEEPLLENLRLLVSEVVTNSIRHGQGFHPIELRVSVRPLVVRVEVEDRGPGFEPRLADGTLDPSFAAVDCSSSLHSSGTRPSQVSRVHATRATAERGRKPDMPRR